jgi:hypothetical protein
VISFAWMIVSLRITQKRDSDPPVTVSSIGI